MLVDKIAKEFSKNLLLEIGKINILIVISKNKEFKDICFSHNFCDANTIMYKSLKNILKTEPELNLDSTITLFNVSWQKAIDNNFYLRR